MSQFYIEYKKQGLPSEYYALSCTSALDVRYSGRATTNPVESRANISDHYVKDNMSISFDGVITNIKNISLPDNQQRSVEENISKLENLWLTGEPFTVYWREGEQPYKNFVFSSLSLTKQSGSGTSYRANLQMTQIQISEQAELVTIPDQEKKVSDKHSSKISNGGNTTKAGFTQRVLNWFTATPTFLLEGIKTGSQLVSELNNNNNNGG